MKRQNKKPLNVVIRNKNQQKILNVNAITTLIK